MSLTDGVAVVPTFPATSDAAASGGLLDFDFGDHKRKATGSMSQLSVSGSEVHGGVMVGRPMTGPNAAHGTAAAGAPPDHSTSDMVQQPAVSGAGLVPSNTVFPGRVGSNGALSVAQRQELALARRRADRAAAGKRTRVLSGLLEVSDGGGPNTDSGLPCDDELDFTKHSEEIEARIAAMDDGKEAKRLKRLLRNRISAQQARERKKTYVSTLESRAQDLEDKCEGLEHQVKKLDCENKVLRRIIMNMKQQSDNMEQ